MLSPIAYAVIHCNVEVYYVGKIRIGRPSNQRRVVLRRRNTVVGGKYALPSALIVQYVYTVVASSRAVSDPESARSLGRASTGLSIAGIVVTVVVIIIVYVTVFRAAGDVSSSSSSYCSRYTYLGTCYRYKEYVGYSGSCSGVRTGGYCYYN